ncbi:isoaspartyl peptidase/L-asparaginase family protein [Brevundimonas naejangsanensis]|uniref:isoaspartyl peptidase/L-asparaginase family protein n=1 Tax=Brevundimonas naejangsanensis TaxID=588932 RepID=UPI0026EA2675|nr:isoaspartyl peptidase/L-asparaginase [Brevundimonas naejangsanensis]
MAKPALILHGGAGARRERNYDAEVVHMREVVEAMKARLDAGASALDVAVEAVVMLEDSGLYVAGRGASPNLAGDYELDASIMDGATGKAGAVAALQGFRNPVVAARAVMDRTPHVMLAGNGAARFAAEQGLARVEEPAAWFTGAGKGEDNHPPGVLSHGTVGCCVLDSQGRLAAATSTGGMTAKRWGRVGDVPVIGAGTYASNADGCAVSATGSGEYFIRATVARDICSRTATGASVQQAADAEIAEVGSIGGDGGVIVMGKDGVHAFSMNTSGMYRGAVSSTSPARVAIYGDEEAAR